MHRSSVPNRAANASSPAIRSPFTDRSYAILARDPSQEHLANLCYLDRESDYYVVIVAGRYGTVAADGLSFTEKEYDYAREIKKPVLAFVHGDRASIPNNKTESDAAMRAKLEDFIGKVSRSPVSFFTNAHSLATEVTVSFVNLRDRQPAVGFIRADQAPDLKKYSELLEEVTRLRTELSTLRVEPKIELSSDPQDGCLVTPIRLLHKNYQNNFTESKATSIRVKAQANTTVGPRNVAAYITKLERKTDVNWEESKYHEMVPLRWAGTDTLETDISNLFPKYAGVLHIDESDNVITVPGVPVPLSLPEFFKAVGTYRVTVSVMAEGMTSQTRFEIDWKGQWNTIEMRPT
jgi:hypothetical protein